MEMKYNFRIPESTMATDVTVVVFFSNNYFIVVTVVNALVTEPGIADTSADVCCEGCGVGPCQKPWTAHLAYSDYCKVN